jgi:ribose transport system substrate-binding protein
MRLTDRRLGPWPRLLLAGSAAILAVTACGTSSGGGSSSSNSGISADALSQVKTLYTQESGPSQWPNPGPAFDSSKAKGKKVWWISNLGSNSFTKLVYDPFKEAMTAAGAQVTFFDGQGQASEEIRGMQQAVAAKADLIIDQDYPVAQTQAGFDAAKAAGIPVLEWANNDAGKGPSPNGGVAEVTYCYSCSGKLMAHAAIVQSSGNVNAVFITSSDVEPAAVVLQGLKGEFDKYCPNTCKVDVKDVVIADWSTKLAVTASTAVANQKVNWLIPAFDPETAFTNPALIQAGAASRVKVASYNATKGNVDRLKQPGDPLAADVGSPLGWSGYAIADNALRILAGVTPVKDEKIPLRTFDRTNIGTVDLNASDATWYGPTDYKVEYKKLWGITG